MAEGKKSFVLYSDLIHTVKKMPKEKAGELFLHMLEYVNDLDPKTDDLLIELAFEPIKQQLKRDLEKWEERAERSRKNGSLGGRPKKNPEEPKETQNNPLGFSGTQTNPDEPRKPVNVNDNVSVNVNDNVNKKKRLKENLEERTNEFKSKVLSFRTEFETPLLKSFFEYWSECNDDGWIMKFEKEKTFSTKHRLTTWKKNESKFSGKTQDEKVILKKAKPFLGYS